MAKIKKIKQIKKEKRWLYLTEDQIKEPNFEKKQRAMQELS